MRNYWGAFRLTGNPGTGKGFSRREHSFVHSYANREKRANPGRRALVMTTRRAKLELFVEERKKCCSRLLLFCCALAK